jgi:peptidase, M20/M25/M40 family
MTSAPNRLQLSNGSKNKYKFQKINKLTIKMDIKNYIEQNKDSFLSELFDLLRMPSVSADSAYKPSIEATAQWVKESLLKAGCDTAQVCETPGNPVVYGEKHVGDHLPTVLVYGHYDVQPADPIELWDTEPFEPVIKTTELHPEGAIFARGACDDKGQMFMHVKAFEYMVKEGKLPCNIKFMIEGEEEVGSKNLGWFVEKNKEKLKNDIILISDTSIIGRETPSITTSLRGLSYLQVEVTGPNRDLHSGVYGGAVANPVNILAQMIAQLHDEHHRVTIPHFYDKVKEFSAEERALFAKIPFSLEEYKKDLGVKDVLLEDGYSVIESSAIRPTLDVNGIWGGYIGEGAKTIIPSKASAKISMRLVPNQDNKEIEALFTEHIQRIAPEGVTVKVTNLGGGPAYAMSIDNDGYRAAEKAMEKTFGKRPVPSPEGGSIPIVALFERELGTKSILMGFGFDSDLIHSPNEHYGLFNFFKGIETIPYFYEYYVEAHKK